MRRVPTRVRSERSGRGELPILPCRHAGRRRRGRRVQIPLYGRNLPQLPAGQVLQIRRHHRHRRQLPRVLRRALQQQERCVGLPSLPNGQASTAHAQRILPRVCAVQGRPARGRLRDAAEPLGAVRGLPCRPRLCLGQAVRHRLRRRPRDVAECVLQLQRGYVAEILGRAAGGHPRCLPAAARARGTACAVRLHAGEVLALPCAGRCGGRR